MKLCLLSLSAKTNVFKQSIRRSVMVRRGTLLYLSTGWRQTGG